MSLDTAPYPAGVPKPGTFVVRCITSLTAMHCSWCRLWGVSGGRRRPSCPPLAVRPARASIIADCQPHAAQAADGDSALVGARVKTAQVQYISALVECVHLPASRIAMRAVVSLLVRLMRGTESLHRRVCQ